jgi:hypothetical protein
METITLKVFSFEELDEEAKEKAINLYRVKMDYSWLDESRESIEAFCKRFRARLNNWQVDAFNYSFDISVDQSNFRGLKLRDFSRDHMPTGYCLDCDLWQTFFKVFQKTGSAKLAFDAALHAGFAAWRDDLAYQESEEFLTDGIILNDYRFFPDGTEYKGAR